MPDFGWRIYRTSLPRWRAALARRDAAEGVSGPDTDGWIEVMRVSELERLRVLLAPWLTDDFESDAPFDDLLSDVREAVASLDPGGRE